VRLPLCRGGVQLVVVRSGSVGLPRVLLDLTVSRGSSRSSVRRRHDGCPSSGPLRLCLPFSALVSHGLVEPAFLSWVSRTLPSTCLEASTPGTDPKIDSIGSRLPYRESRSVLVVSHHLDGFLRSELAGLLHPAADPGFAAFPSSACPVPPKRHLGMRTLFPATHTPRRTSSSSAVPRHRGHFLPAVSSLERSTFAGAVDET